MTFKKILVAIDRSLQGASVLENALEQGTQSGAELVFLHVIRRPSELQTGPFMGIGTIADIDTYSSLRRFQREQEQRELEKAQQWLQEYIQMAEARGIKATIDCRIGEPSLEICMTAQTWGADLVVLGRRGYQGLSEIVLGSVSNYVLHHAPCTVLVVQSAAQSSDESAGSTVGTGATR